MPNVSSFGAQTDNSVVQGTVTDRAMIIPDIPPQGLMSVGPRVTPHFVNPSLWSALTTYHFFDAVHDAAGASYVAIKPEVPAGTELTDDSYWFLWADPNSQLADLSELVKTFNGRITENEASILSVESDVNREAYYIKGESASEINREILSNTDKIIRFANKKTYNLTEVITVPANCYIDLNECVLKRTETVHNVVNIVGNNVHIENGTIDGNRVADGLSAVNVNDRFDGVNATNVSNVTINKLTVINCVNAEIQDTGTHGAFFANGVTGIALNDCKFDSNDRTGFFYYKCKNVNVNGGSGSNNLGSAISGELSDNVIVTDFSAYDNGYTGISMNGNGLRTINCTSNGNTYSGFDFGHNQETDNDFACIGCTACNNKYEGVSTQYSTIGLISGCYFESNERANIDTLYALENNILVVSDTVVIDGQITLRCRSILSNDTLNGKAPFVVAAAPSNVQMKSCTGFATSGTWGIGVEANAKLSVKDSYFNATNVTNNNLILGSGQYAFSNVECDGYDLPSVTKVITAASADGASFVYKPDKYFAVKLPYNLVFLQVIGSSEQLTETIPEGFRPTRSTTAQYSNGIITVNNDTLISTVPTNSASIIYFTTDMPV